jgi:hexosaminidase
VNSRSRLRALGAAAVLMTVLAVEVAVPAPGNTASIIPLPVKMAAKAGEFVLDDRTVIVARKGTEAEAGTLAEALRGATGKTLHTGPATTRSNCIVLEIDTSLTPQLGGEGYRLSVSKQNVLIRAGSEAGLFYGGITLRQLLPIAAANPARIACVEIEDRPRFPWRGLLLDPARHFVPVEFVKRFIDLMALHKFNTLQLHLTDDQGWRLEIRRYPRLTTVGSIRKESPKRGDRTQGDGTPYGPFFYTQQQIREIVAYAGARHITILPEFEIPGHFLAALTAYPELSCRGQHLELRTRWGVEPDILCAGNDAGLEFVRNVLTEICELFPSPFIHIGGDESPRTRWKECPKCQARIKAEGLKDEAQLQSWLNGRLEEFLATKGRRMIGWDEILEGGLTPGAAVMSWRGVKGGIAAAEAGHDVVMSPTTHCYFDYAQGRDPGEPESIGGFIPLSKVYEFEPVQPAIPAANREHVIGVQANCWSEFMWTPADVEYFAFPRAAALAEVAWSPAEARSYDAFLTRLRVHLKRLDSLKVNYRPLRPEDSKPQGLEHSN